MFLLTEEQNLKIFDSTPGIYESNVIKNFNGFEECLGLKADERTMKTFSTTHHETYGKQ